MRDQYGVPDRRALARYGLAKLAADPSALKRLGLAIFDQLPQVAEKPGVVNWLARQGRGAAELARLMYLGSPVGAWRMWQHTADPAAHGVGGALKHYGRYAKEFFWPTFQPVHLPGAEAVGSRLHSAMHGLDKGTRLTPEHVEHLRRFGVEHIPVKSFWANAGHGLGLATSLGMTGLDLYGALTGPKEQRRGDLAAAVAGLAISPVTGYLGLPGGLLHGAVTNAARRLGHRFDTPTVPPHDLAFTPRFDQMGQARRALRAHGALAALPAAVPLDSPT